MAFRNWPKDEDGDALRRVVASGSDLSRPMPIDFFVEVEDEASGRKLAAEAAKLGFETQIAQDPEDDAWSCICTRMMLATYEGVVEAQAQLAQLAEPFGGEADGWGTRGNAE